VARRDIRGESHCGPNRDKLVGLLSILVNILWFISISLINGKRGHLGYEPVEILIEVSADIKIKLVPVSLIKIQVYDKQMIQSSQLTQSLTAHKEINEIEYHSVVKL
jgi:hypothetical protein